MKHEFHLSETLHQIPHFLEHTLHTDKLVESLKNHHPHFHPPHLSDFHLPHLHLPHFHHTDHHPILKSSELCGFAFLCSLSFNTTTYAASSSSGTITVAGYVPMKCAISATTYSGNEEDGMENVGNLNSDVTNRPIGTINERCNSASGYTVTIQGSNSGDHQGKFIDTASGNEQPFSISYNGAPVPGNGTITNSNSKVTGNGINKTVAISYNANDNLTGTPDSSYEETLTFTITAK